MIKTRSRILHSPQWKRLSGMREVMPCANSIPAIIKACLSTGSISFAPSCSIRLCAMMRWSATSSNAESEDAVMLVGGAAELDAQALDLYTLYVLRPGHRARLSSAEGGRLMLMGGAAFTTRRYVFWNFVSSSRDRINQAKEDWKAQRFPTIPGDDQEFIPLPEVPKTVSYP